MIKDDLTILKSENDRLKKENIDLKERLLYMEAKNKKIQSLIDKINEQRLKINRLLYYFPF